MAQNSQTCCYKCVTIRQIIIMNSERHFCYVTNGNRKYLPESVSCYITLSLISLTEGSFRELWLKRLTGIMHAPSIRRMHYSLSLRITLYGVLRHLIHYKHKRMHTMIYFLVIIQRFRIVNPFRLADLTYQNQQKLSNIYIYIYSSLLVL